MSGPISHVQDTKSHHVAYLNVGKMRCKIGATISGPYLACAAAMRAWRWVASNTGGSELESDNKFDMSFAIC